MSGPRIVFPRVMERVEMERVVAMSVVGVIGVVLVVVVNFSRKWERVVVERPEFGPVSMERVEGSAHLAAMTVK